MYYYVLLDMSAGGNFGLAGCEVPGCGSPNEGSREVGEVAGVVSARGIGPRRLTIGKSGRQLQFCPNGQWRGFSSAKGRRTTRQIHATQLCCEQSRAGTCTGSSIVVDKCKLLSVIWEHEPKPSSRERTTSPVSSLNRVVICEKPVIDVTIKTVVHALN
jgi:hypothetical protein